MFPFLTSTSHRETLKIFFEEDKIEHLSDNFLQLAFSKRGVSRVHSNEPDQWTEYSLLHKKVGEIDHLFIRIIENKPKIPREIQAWDISKPNASSNQNHIRMFSQYIRESTYDSYKAFCQQRDSKDYDTNRNFVPVSLQAFNFSNQTQFEKLPTPTTIPREKFDEEFEAIFKNAPELLPYGEGSRPTNPLYLVSALVSATALLYLAVACTKSLFPFRPAKPLNVS